MLKTKLLNLYSDLINICIYLRKIGFYFLQSQLGNSESRTHLELSRRIYSNRTCLGAEISVLYQMSVLQLASRITTKLESFGFDLHQFFKVHTYNNFPGVSAKHHLPELLSSNDTVALLIGNSKALWEPFKAKADLSVINPLDEYTVNVISQVCQSDLSANEVPYAVYFTHNAPGQDRIIAFQKLVHAIGFAYLDASMHLCVHPSKNFGFDHSDLETNFSLLEYGPWFALRAVIVFGTPLPDQIVRETKEIEQSPCLRKIFLIYLQFKTLFFLEYACDKLSRDKFVEASTASKSTWESWLSIRQVCQVGKEYAYSEEQSVYHYTGILNQRGI